jgi:hypothetical protein
VEKIGQSKCKWLVVDVADMEASVSSRSNRGRHLGLWSALVGTALDGNAVTTPRSVERIAGDGNVSLPPLLNQLPRLCVEHKNWGDRRVPALGQERVPRGRDPDT